MGEAAIWQRNYRDRVIRAADDANRIHFHIESDPDNWANDEENPAKITP